MLIDKGANLTAKDDMGRTALHWLCTLPSELDSDHQKLVTEMLIQSPGLLTQKDNAGLKTFHIVAQNRHTHLWLIMYLLSQGTDSNEPSQMTDPNGNTILHHLAPKLLGDKTSALKAAEQFKSMLALGVPINYRNHLGETPLHLFIAHSWEWTRKPNSNNDWNDEFALANDITHTKALPIFVDAGADFHTRNVCGENLLHATAGRWSTTRFVPHDQKEDMLRIFNLLMARGVDPREEDEMCRTAIDVAVAGGNGFLVKLFGVKEVVVVEGTRIYRMGSR